MSGWPSISVATRQHLDTHAGQFAGREQPGDDPGSARAEAATERDRGSDPELEVVGGMHALERTHHQVRAVAPERQVGDNRKASGLDHLDLQMAAERRRQHVEAGTEVGAGSGNPDANAGGTHRSLTTGSLAGSPQDHALDGAELGLARDHAADLGEGGVVILEPVAGQHACDALGAAGSVGDQAGDRSGGGGLAEDPLLARQKVIGGEDLLRR